MKLEEEKTGNNPSSRLFFHIPGTPRRSFSSPGSKSWFFSLRSRIRADFASTNPLWPKNLCFATDAVSSHKTLSLLPAHFTHTIYQSCNRPPNHPDLPPPLFFLPHSSQLRRRDRSSTATTPHNPIRKTSRREHWREWLEMYAIWCPSRRRVCDWWWMGRRVCPIV